MIKPNEPIKKVSEAWLKENNAYTTIPVELNLRRSDSRPDVLILEILNQGESGHRHFRFSRRLFLEWMKNKVQQLESD